MAQLLNKVLENLSSPNKMADIIMKISGARKAAKILKAYIPSGFRSPIAVVAATPFLLNSSAFKSYYNCYKKSSYYSPTGISFAFANEIMKYL